MSSNFILWLSCISIVACSKALVVDQRTGLVYDRCELARELIDVHGFDRESLGDWVCLIQYGSSFDTTYIYENEDGSRDYGIFQITDTYWCDVNVSAGAECEVA